MSWTFAIRLKLRNQWFIGVNGKCQFTEDLKFGVRDRDIETDVSED